MTEDEMVGWHHRLDWHEFEQALGVGDGQGSLAFCSPLGHKESDTTEWLNWTDLKDTRKRQGIEIIRYCTVGVCKRFRRVSCMIIWNLHSINNRVRGLSDGAHTYLPLLFSCTAANIDAIFQFFLNLYLLIEKNSHCS